MTTPTKYLLDESPLPRLVKDETDDACELAMALSVLPSVPALR